VSIDITSIDATIAFFVISLRFFCILVIINNINQPVIFKDISFVYKVIVIIQLKNILKCEGDGI
jgi:hypothetical protein